MADPTSRYARAGTALFTTPSGRQVAYTLRRIPPQGTSLPAAAEARAQPGERVDNLAFRLLGDPLQFWRLCDANDVMDPAELTEEAGRRTLRVPLPQG